MCAKSVPFEDLIDEVAGVLVDRAYPVALQHGVQGSSVDIELDVWKALRATLSAQNDGEPPVAQDMSAALTQAAYQVALRRGFSGSFVDVELDLWKALRLPN